MASSSSSSSSGSGSGSQTQPPENIRVVMVLNSLKNHDESKTISLPEGFYFRMYQDERDNTEWRRIQRGADEFTRVDDDLFDKEFLSKGVEEVRKRVIFVAQKKEGGEEEELVGSIAAWWFPSWRDGEDYGRIHWVAIAKEHQGKGLGKAMTQEALNLLKSLGHERVFLVTHTRRIVAIKMYAGFGFVPDLHEPKDKENWAKVPMFADYVLSNSLN